MVMLDRRKLAVPLFAQAGAFVAVLVIGGFTSHAAPKPPVGVLCPPPVYPAGAPSARAARIE